MFAVPGWNLDATAPKVQQAAPKANSNNSKKRKRKDAKQSTQQISGDNVGDMWARVVEGGEGGPTSGANNVPVSKEQGKKDGKQDKKDKKAKDNKVKEAGKDVKGEGEGSKPKNKKQRRESEGAGSVKAEGKAEEKVVAEKPEESKKGAKGKAGELTKNKKDNKNGKKQQKHQDSEPAAVEITAPVPTLPTTVAPPLPPANAKLTPLQAKMREKLVGARFRHLNQTLYTTPSQHSLKLIEDDPQIFAEYHAGFRQQVRDWPENPVDTFVALVCARGAVRENWRDKILKRKEKEVTSGRYRAAGTRPEDEVDVDSEEEERKAVAKAAAPKPLPRTRGTSIIADLGCGDAALATQLQPHLHSLGLRVHSFDLAAPSPLITKADIASLPLEDGSVDVAVFCLALMGTNWLDFVDEAWRVLHWKGELWVAEIKSRFGRVSNKKAPGEAVDHSVGKRQKKKAEAARKKTGADKKDREAAAADEEKDLAVEVDGVASGRAETDVSAFVEVLRKRGFVLDAEPGRDRDAVDLGNKMFVRMSFVKMVAPVKGKNVKANEKIYAEKAAQLAEESGKTFRKKDVKPKFIDANEDEVDETAVLKPCLYKQR